MNDARFSALASRLGAILPGDRYGLQQVRTDLAVLRELVGRLLHRELAEFLDAADTMVRNLSALEGEAFDQVRDMVVTLIGVVSEAVASATAPARPQQEPPSRLAPGEESSVRLDELPPVLRSMGDFLLGQILVESGVIERAQLVSALKHQATHGCRIGDALVSLSVATREEVAAALRTQHELVRGGEGAGASGGGSRLLSEMLLGEILVRISGLSRADLERGLRMQRASGKLLGETLVEMGATSWARVEEAVRIQRSGRIDTGTASGASGYSDTGGVRRLRLDH